MRLQGDDDEHQPCPPPSPRCRDCYCSSAIASHRDGALRRHRRAVRARRSSAAERSDGRTRLQWVRVRIRARDLRASDRCCVVSSACRQPLTTIRMPNAPAIASPAAALRFGRFELRPSERVLFAGGAPGALGARAFDLLVAFVDRPGALITKDELLATVWEGLVVEENNLQVQVSTLRK